MTKDNTETVTTRMTKEEKKRLDELRKEDKAGLNMTQYIRRVLREHLTREKNTNG